jgi:hypothetical protein
MSVELGNIILVPLYVQNIYSTWTSYNVGLVMKTKILLLWLYIQQIGEAGGETRLGLQP